MNNKKNIINFTLVAFFALIIFTPIRTYIQRALLLEPSTKKIKKEDLININNINLSLMDYQGNKIELNNLKNKVVFINYFGTWCPPCVAEMPSLQKLYESKHKNIKFIFVPIRDEKQKVIDFMNENKYTLPVYEPLNLIDEKIAPNVFPTVLIFDKKGNLILKEEGSYDWNSKKIHDFLDKIL